MDTFLLRRSTKIISVLPFAGEYAAERGVPKEKVVWIPSGLDFDRYANLKPYHGERRDPFTVMYMGGHVRSNAIDVILRAAKVLQNSVGPRVQFVFVGGGQEKPNLIKFARELQLQNVEFRKSVPKNQLSRAMEEADAFVLCRRDPTHKYGYNLNKLHDYLASGRPIIFATNARYNPVQLAGAGLVVSPESPEELARAIWQMISMTPEQRVQMGENGRRFAEEQLDIRLLAGRLETVLNQAVNQIAHRAPDSQGGSNRFDISGPGDVKTKYGDLNGQ
jgi:glycosyltransferase involved in cell wall biosynthesis